MKKIFQLLMIVTLSIICLGAYSQESTTYDASLSYDNTYRVDGLSSSDVLGTGDSIWFYTIKKLTRGKVKCSFKIAYDTLVGITDSSLTTVYYKRWLKDPWIEDYRFVYYGSADTTVTVDLDTARVADYWKVYTEGYSDEFLIRIDSISFKFTE